ncbi:MAG: PTS sugar transporter subunit IIA [Planctomycetota bacterium]
MIKQLVASAAILAEVKASTKDAALKELLQTAQEAGAFPKKAASSISKKISAREALGSTGIGNGVAVPHVKSDSVKQVALVLGRSTRGIEWHSIDGKPVQIMFLLAAPPEASDLHLQCLRWISGLARSADFRRFFLNSPDEAAIRDLLQEMAPAA